MRVQRALALLAAAALVAPLAALAMPACAPGQHCPMAGVMADGPPCHGTAIQADDCCVTSAAAEPADVVPVIGVTAPAASDNVPAPQTEPGNECATNPRVDHPSTPLFRLFRALLI